MLTRGRSKNGQQSYTHTHTHTHTHTVFLKKKNAVYVIFILARYVLITLPVVGGTARKKI
jgi:hypothetical protein